MSFDLYLRGDHLTLADILDHCAEYPELERKELPDSAYALINAATGVYCYFSMDESEANSLCLSLNYNRPTFFALETLPVVESLCRRFNLLVEDPQEEVVQPASSNDLIQSWRIHNERAVKAINEQGMALNYMPEDKANDWWAYTRVKEEITANLGESVFVPEVFILKRPSEEPFRMIVRPEGNRQLLPPCDVVCIVRSDDGSPSEITDQGFVSYEAFLDRVGAYTSEYRIGTHSYRLLDPTKHPEVISLTRDLELVPASNLEQVAPDGFHNVVLG